jgi:hypothetical protein
MPLPLFEVYDPDGDLLGSYESRANAEEAVRRDIAQRAGEYVISDERFRAQERAEQDAERKREQERRSSIDRQRQTQADFAAKRQ